LNKYIKIQIFPIFSRWYSLVVR